MVAKYSVIVKEFLKSLFFTYHICQVRLTITAQIRSKLYDTFQTREFIIGAPKHHLLSPRT